jgi:hypothetical protein
MPNPSDGYATWVQTACDEITGRTGENHLREFLWSLGAATDAGRGAYQAIVRVFEILTETKPQPDLINELLDTVAQYSPSAVDARTLTTVLLSEATKWPRPRLAESKLLWEIGTNTHDALLDPVGLEVRSRSQSLWRTDRSAATKLLRDFVDTHPNSVGEEVIDAICEVLGAVDAIDLAQERAGLLPVLLSRNPKLAVVPTVWKSAPTRHREMFDAIARAKKIPDDLLLDVARAIMISGADDVAEDALSRLVNNPVHRVLEIYDRTLELTPDKIGHSWRRLLARDPGGLLNWLEESSSPRLATVALIVSLLDPRASEVRRFDADFWLKYASGEAPLDQGSRVNMMAFFLALALDNAIAGADKLTAFSFQTVYEAAANDRLGFEPWRLLQDLVPSLGWWREWDKCERLIHGLIDRFSRLRWSSQEFLHSLRGEKALRQALEATGRDYSARQYLRRIAEEVRSGALHATELQVRLLRSL